MTDKELADKVVALGVGRQGEYPKSADGCGFYYTPTDANTHEEEGLYSKLFVRDWRVAGTMLAMYYDAYAAIDDVIQTFEGDPRAITEACVEALEA